MVIYIINTFFYLINVISYSVLSQDKLFIKTIIIIILLSVLKFFTVYPRMLGDDPFVIANYYKIANNFSKALTFAILFIYILIFILGIFYLRLSNQQKITDLKVILDNIYSNILAHTIFCNFINITLFILLLITYIYALAKLLSFFRRYWIKLHIYYAQHNDNWYIKYIYDFYRKFHYHHLLTNFSLIKYPKIGEILGKKLLGFSLKYHLLMLIRNIHYIILIIVFLYDIVYCNFVLNTMYNMLPFLFVYDLYIRFCNLFSNLDHMYMADYTAHAFIYANTIKVINTEEVCINGEAYSTRGVANAICVYLRTGLNAKLLCEAYGDKYPFYEFGYFKEWKNT